MSIYINDKRSTFLQFSAAIPLAALTTFTLILLMHRLVFTEFIPPDMEDAPKFPNIIYDERPTPQARREPIEKPEPVENPPETKPTPKTSSTDSKIQIKLPEVKLSEQKIHINNAGGRYPIAQVFSSPRYPARALTRGIEGWATVKFDITALGSTENIRVIDSQPQGYFERAAISAAKHWKYQPFIDEQGEAKAFAGMTKKLVFEIDASK